MSYTGSGYEGPGSTSLPMDISSTPPPPGLRSKTPWTKTKTLGLKRRLSGLKRRLLWIKLLRRLRSVVEFPLRYLIVIMKSITHLFFDLRLRKSSVLKCRTIVSINTFTKQNNRRRKEKTRHLAMMNSRREEPRVLFITFYLINRKKKPSIENITRVKVYISSFMQARFICIHAGLYLYPCYFILTSIVKKK